MRQTEIKVNLETSVEFMSAPQSKADEIARNMLNQKIQFSSKYLQEGIRKFLTSVYCDDFPVQ